VRVAFPVDRWIEQSEKKKRLEGGGLGRPKPPLFPAEYGRHMQRPFRDMLADLLPPEYGYQPTLQIGDFEVLPWIYATEAEPGCASFFTNGSDSSAARGLSSESHSRSPNLQGKVAGPPI
jgi:hypothetical protein